MGGAGSGRGGSFFRFVVREVLGVVVFGVIG